MSFSNCECTPFAPCPEHVRCPCGSNTSRLCKNEPCVAWKESHRDDRPREEVDGEEEEDIFAGRVKSPLTQEHLASLASIEEVGKAVRDLEEKAQDMKANPLHALLFLAKFTLDCVESAQHIGGLPDTYTGQCRSFNKNIGEVSDELRRRIDSKDGKGDEGNLWMRFRMGYVRSCIVLTRKVAPQVAHVGDKYLNAVESATAALFPADV
jgi:hypothetical protein